MKESQKNSVRYIAIAAALCVVALGPAPRPPVLAAPQEQLHDESEESHGPMCGEHDVLENECGICQPDLADELSPGQGLKIRLSSSVSASRAGIETAPPSFEAISDGVACYAEIAFDQNRTACVVSPADGVLDDVDVDLGTRVRAGQTLARLSSATIAEAQSEHLRALAEARLQEQTHKRERSLFEHRVNSEKDVQEASAALEAANAVVQQSSKRLRVLGFDDDRIEALGSTGGGATGALELKAPLGGEIIERNAVRGSRVESGATLFTIADRSVVWGMLSIPEAELSRVQLGQRVRFEPNTPRDETFEGRITWISAQVDPRTRMTRARVEIQDGAGTPRSGSFARAWIETSNEGRALVVPEAAIQRVHNKPFVFVRLADDLYEARAVELGKRRDGRVEITAGLGSEDRVAVAHSYAVKSELLKSRLGAGCADD